MENEGGVDGPKKWNFPESKYTESTINWVKLKEDRYECTLHKITEFTANTKWGLKEAIRLGFMPTHEALAEAGIQLKDDEMAYITKTVHLSRSEKGNLWKLLKQMAFPEEMEKLQASDAAGIQAAYEAMIGRTFDVLVILAHDRNFAESVYRTKKKKVAPPKKEEPTGFEDMPDKKAKSEIPDVSFDDDDIPF